VRSAIRSLLTSKPSSLIEASRFARLPFERCWFEWTPPGDAPLHENQLSARRVGALIEPYGPHGFTIWTAWEFKEGAILADLERDHPSFVKLADDIPPFGFSALVGAYDLSSMVLPPLMLQDDKHWFQPRPVELSDLEGLRDDQRNPIKWALKNPSEWMALRQLSQRAAYRVHAEMNGDEKIAMQMDFAGDINSLVHDVQDEMGHLLATLILMNAKNCVQIAPTEAPMKLNKARRKQGKTELLPYSTVRIELSKHQQRAIEGGLISREEARRHPVRGHFKVRASGVFWWSETWRGNPLRGTIDRRVHIIEAGA
jgi:hypothetical protein